MKKIYEVKVNNNFYKVELCSELAGITPKIVKINNEDFNIDIDDLDNINSVLLNDISYSIEKSEDYDIENGGELFISGDSHIIEINEEGMPKMTMSKNEQADGTVKSQIAGKISKINFKRNDELKQNDLVMIIEAMKMENEINAPISGIISEIFVKVNDEIKPGEELFKIIKK